MKTKSLFVAAVAIMMAACSETDNISVQNTAQQAETAVSFDTYMGRATTRAGAVGEITTKEELQIDNFGVFAYYTNGDLYPTNYNNDPLVTTAKFTPNFMWNQKVEYDGDKWFYFPVKYWPNESSFGSNYVDAADPTENHATTTGAATPDKVTFFAYAPYVEATTSGAVTPNNDGITAIFDPNSTLATPPAPYPALNAVKSDPFIAYTTPTDPLKTVDLLWGVVPSYKTKYSTVTTEQEVTAGKPNYNLWKQTTDERIMFQFKHALAKLTLDVVGFFDDIPGEGANKSPEAVSENNVAKDTKIVIEYVKLSTLKYPSSSVLNLNNYQAADKPNWVQAQTNAGGNISFDISGSQLTNLIRYRTPSDVTKGYAEQPRGVTKDAIALLANDASQEAFFGIIPQTVTSPAAYANAKWTVEIKYHVFTKDPNLENGYSEITNVIKKEDINMDFVAGKHYTLRLRLGMTTVKFDATVEDWIDGNTTPADLPINVAVKSVDNGTFTATSTSLTNYKNYTATSTGKFGTGATALSLENISYKLTVSDVQATLVNGTAADVSASAEAVTIGTDVDWIKPVWNGTSWDLVVTENLTSATRTGKIWATYGGVDSDPVTVSQNGSNLVLTLQYNDNNTTQSTTYNGRGPWTYEVYAQYRDAAESTHFIDVSKDANVKGNFNIDANWATISPTANNYVGLLQLTSDNEDEVNLRTATISYSYDGKTSNTITVTQTKKE